MSKENLENELEVVEDTDGTQALPLPKKLLAVLFLVVVTFLVVPYVLYVFDVVSNLVMLLLMIPAILISLFVIIYLWRKSKR